MISNKNQYENFLFIFMGFSSSENLVKTWIQHKIIVFHNLLI